LGGKLGKLGYWKGIIPLNLLSHCGPGCGKGAFLNFPGEGHYFLPTLISFKPPSFSLPKKKGVIKNPP